MSLKTISEMTGFSVSTVSKAFSGKSDISESSRTKIFKAAEKIGLYEKYAKNKFDKKIAALIIPEFKSEYYSDAVSRFSECFSRRSTILTVAESNFDSKRVNELFSYFAYHARCDGIIIFDNAANVKNPDKFPTVIVGNSQNHPYDCIDLDIQNTLNELLLLLKKNGHRKIAFIGEELTSSKRDAFISAMRLAKLPLFPELIKTVSEIRFEEAGYKAMSDILDGELLPTAVVAAYDYMAIGAIRCMNERSIKIPDDISIVGMDNTYVGENLSVPLTSVASFPENMYEPICDMLMKKIENKYISVKTKKIHNTTIINRESIKNITAD